VPSGQKAHVVDPVVFVKAPSAHGAHAVTGNVYRLDAVPAAQGAHVPVFDCPGAHGQLSGVAHDSTVVPLKSCAAVGIAGQLYTSLSHTAFAFKPVQAPAR